MNNSDMACPICLEGKIVLETEKKDFDHNGASLFYQYDNEYCDHCGSMMHSAETVKNNLERKLEVQRQYDNFFLAAICCG